MKIEYKIRPVTRWVVTRWFMDEPTEDESGTTFAGRTGVDTKGEFASPEAAYEVGYALCKDEHARLGYPVGDERIKYPVQPPAPAQLGGNKSNGEGA